MERTATSITCRSPWPRRSASRSAAAFYEEAGACATWSRTTSCRCSRWSRWSRRPRSRPTPCATRRPRCCARSAPTARSRTPCAASTGAGSSPGEEVPGYREEEGVTPDSTADLHRGQARDRQLALGGRAVLSAHRQAAAQARHRGRHPVQARAAPAVHAWARPSTPRPTRSCCGSSPTRASRCASARRRRATVAVRTVNMDFQYGTAFLHDAPRRTSRCCSTRCSATPRSSRAGRGRALVGALRSPCLSSGGRGHRRCTSRGRGAETRVRADHARRAALAAAVIAHPPVEVTDLSQVEHALAASREGGVGGFAPRR